MLEFITRPPSRRRCPVLYLIRPATRIPWQIPKSGGDEEDDDDDFPLLCSDRHPWNDFAT